MFCKVLCTASHLNCSEPSQPQLLQALTPIFNLSAIRPVMNMTTSTDVSVYFILYGVLGVVSPRNLTKCDDLTVVWWHLNHKFHQSISVILHVLFWVFKIPVVTSGHTVLSCLVFQDEKAQVLITYLWLHYVSVEVIPIISSICSFPWECWDITCECFYLSGGRMSL